MIALAFVTATLIEQRHPAAGVLGLLAIFRPEGLLAAPCSLWATWRDRAIAAASPPSRRARAHALLRLADSAEPHREGDRLQGRSPPWGAPQWWEWLLPLPFTPGASSRAAHVDLRVLLAGRVRRSRRNNGRGGTPRRARRGAAGSWLALFATGASWFFWYFAALLLAGGDSPAWAAGRSRNRPHLYVAAALMLAGQWLAGRQAGVGARGNRGRAFRRRRRSPASPTRAGESVFLEPIGTIGAGAIPNSACSTGRPVAPAVAKRCREGAGLVHRHDSSASVRSGW